VDGRTLDNGLHILLGAYRETLRLIDRVRPSEAPYGLQRRPLALHIEPSFRLSVPRLPAPLHLAVALTLARGLSWRDKLSAAAFIGALRRSRFRCEPSLTVARLLSLHGQTDPLNRFLWRPLCVSALNTLPEEASAQIFLNVLRDSLGGQPSDSDLLLPEMDFSALFPERAQAYVAARDGEVRLGEVVKDIEPRSSGFRVDEKDFTQVVVCVGPHRLDTVLGGITALQPVLRQVARYEYRPIYSIYLQYPAGTRLPEPMLGFAGGLVQWVFDRAALCGQDGLLAAVISGDGDHENLSHEELARRVHDELASRWPALPAPAWHQVIAEKRATFACVAGIERPACRTAVPGLFLAGDYVDSPYPATLEAAVCSGVTAARLILTDTGNLTAEAPGWDGVNHQDTKDTKGH
jgi:squalene-associated FAD-dependent desaturase